jgi:hypothetical protein
MEWWAAFTPQEWIDRLGQQIKVYVKGSPAPLDGFLFSIDPEQHHIMLLRFAATESAVCLCPSKANR